MPNVSAATAPKQSNEPNSNKSIVVEKIVQNNRTVHSSKCSTRTQRSTVQRKVADPATSKSSSHKSAVEKKVRLKRLGPNLMKRTVTVVEKIQGVVRSSR